MASYSSPDTATDCSDVLTLTKWLTYTNNRTVKGLEEMLEAMYAILRSSEDGSIARPFPLVLSLASLKGSAYGFCHRCTSIFHPINNYHYQPNWRL